MFLQIRSRPPLGVFWNSTPNGFRMKTLRLDAQLLESDFRVSFCFNKTHWRHQIQSIGHAEQNPCCYQQHVSEANMKSSSPSTEAEQVGCCTPAWQRDCFVLCLCLMKLHHQHVVTNTYRVTAATRADRLLTSAHTSSIWLHITVERKSCRCVCEGEKRSDLPQLWANPKVPATLLNSPMCDR